MTSSTRQTSQVMRAWPMMCQQVGDNNHQSVGQRVDAARVTILTSQRRAKLHQLMAASEHIEAPSDKPAAARQNKLM